MKNYLKLKDTLRAEGDKIQIKIVGKLPVVEKTFGGVTKILTPLEVLVNGKAFIWEISEDQKKKIKEAGCGATFWITAYKSRSGYLGFNYVPLDDISLNYGTQEVPPATDDYQIKVSRGAAWNNAFSYLLSIGQYTNKPLNDFCVEVGKIAEKVTIYQSAFVNGSTMAPASKIELVASSQTHETPSSNELPLSDSKTPRDEDYPDFLN